MYNHTWYFISGLPDDTYSCGVADSNKDIEFSSIDDVLDHFIVNGKPLKDILADIDW